MSKYKMNWVLSSSIQPKDSDLRVTQVYCWVYTKDKKVLLVSKDKNNWQFPGGHPEQKETTIETCLREVLEETGVDLGSYIGDLKFLGYYVVDELDDSGKLIEQYLQVRYYIKLEDLSSSLKLFVNEQETEERKVSFVESFSLEEAKQKIPWLAESEELSSFLKETVKLSV